MTTRNTYLLTALVVLGSLTGCYKPEQIVRPDKYRSPYQQNVRWAVVPFADQAPQTSVNTMQFMMAVNQQLQQTIGIDPVPATDVIQAMRQLGIAQIQGAKEAVMLAKELQVDGVLVGSITDWDPYDPPKIGVTVKLYCVSRDPGYAVSPRLLQEAPSDRNLPMRNDYAPTAEVNAYIDAANGNTLTRMKNFALGRTPMGTPNGWHMYLMNMNLYVEFAAHDMLRQIFSVEWHRMYAQASPEQMQQAYARMQALETARISPACTIRPVKR